MSEQAATARLSTEPVAVRNLGLVDYVEAWNEQRRIARERADGVGTDQLLLLEHPSVYTAGRRTAPEDRPTDGTPVIDVDRGGKITWHGPGQLVGYPIVKLAEPVDVVKFVRRLEEALIVVCTTFGIECGRIDGRSGVWLAAAVREGTWIPERKIAAIGVRVQRGVTLHGFSLNCDAALAAYDTIVPCGISDAGVTSLSAEVGRDVTVAEIRDTVADAIVRALDGDLPISDHNVERLTVTDLIARSTAQA